MEELNMDPLVDLYCFICQELLNLESSNSNLKSRQEICAQFRTSVSKFLQMKMELDVDISQLSKFTFSEATEEFTNTGEKNLQMCCEICFGSLKQFCNNYNKLQNLHMELFQNLYGISLRKKTESHRGGQNQKKMKRKSTTLQRCSSIPQDIEILNINDDVDIDIDPLADTLHLPDHDDDCEKILDLQPEIVDLDAIEDDNPEIIFISQNEKVKQNPKTVKRRKLTIQETDPLNDDLDTTGNNIYLPDHDDDDRSNLDRSPELVGSDEDHPTDPQKLDFMTNLFTANLSKLGLGDRPGQTQPFKRIPIPKMKMDPHFGPMHRRGRFRKMHYRCLMCPKPRYFLAERRLILHMSHHIGEKVYICQVCHMEYQNAQNLKHHQVGHHRPNIIDPEEEIIRAQFPFTCKLCQGKFETSSILYRHRIDDHNLKQKFICEEPNCGKKFFQRNNLLAHRLRWHQIDPNNPTPYHCDLCDKKYCVLSYLQNHKQRVHGDKPIVEPKHLCDLCGKRFVRRGQLLSHRRLMHNPERPQKVKATYTCDFEGCGKTFAKKSKLDYHALSHSKERNHQCEHCGEAFKHAYNLKKHGVQKHPEVPFYKCKYCGESFYKFEILKQHRETFHPSNEQIKGLGKWKVPKQSSTELKNDTPEAPAENSH